MLRGTHLRVPGTLNQVYGTSHNYNGRTARWR